MLKRNLLKNLIKRLSEKIISIYHVSFLYFEHTFLLSSPRIPLSFDIHTDNGFTFTRLNKNSMNNRKSQPDLFWYSRHWGWKKKGLFIWNFTHAPYPLLTEAGHFSFYHVVSNVFDIVYCHHALMILLSSSIEDSESTFTSKL